MHRNAEIVYVSEKLVVRVSLIHLIIHAWHSEELRYVVCQKALYLGWFDGTVVLFWEEVFVDRVLH